MHWFFFATIEQQANPRLRGKPIAVTGGDRIERTVVGAASVEAKKFGIRTGMNLRDALKIYPDLILVRGDSDKYLSCTKKFLNILKDYSPFVEVFSIDEAFVQIIPDKSDEIRFPVDQINRISDTLMYPISSDLIRASEIAQEIKQRIRSQIGEWVTCSVGISYNKRMAKLAGSMQKPDGLVVIADEVAAQFVLDRTVLDEICGIGHAIKHRLNNMGIFNFADLRKMSLENLLAIFKSYGQILFNMARGIDETPLVPFYDKEEVKSVGHRHTISHDTDDKTEIKQILLKLSELVARRLRAKKLVGKTVSFGLRYAFDKDYFESTGHRFNGDGMQTTIPLSDDGFEIFQAGWTSFLNIWNGKKIRMVGISVSNVTSKLPQNLSLLDDVKRQDNMTQVLDKLNDTYGEFSVFRGVLLNSKKICRRPNSFLADVRFKI